MDYFLNHTNYIADAATKRKEIDPKSLCTWGIDYLDWHFGGGIAPRSFNLIACESGRGKTTLVSNMAVQNSRIGKRVAFIRLEGDMYDFPDTEKWKHIAPFLIQWKKQGLMTEYFDYQAYRLNRIPNIEDLEESAEKIIKKDLKNIKLFNKQKIPVNKTTIKPILDSLENKSDLIIIDHLHYFDVSEEANKWIEQMQTVKIINEFVDRVGTPVILVSHVRKGDSKSKKPLLSMEDIQGSSDIFKIAHTVLFMSPHYQAYDQENKRYPTLFYSPKSRYGASTTRVGIKTFNGYLKEYEKGYNLAEQVYDDGQWKVQGIKKDANAENNFN